MRSFVWISTVGSIAALTARQHDEHREQVIQQLNAQPNMLWKAGHNPRFTGQPVGASKSLCGVKEESLKMLQTFATPATKRDTNFKMPTSFDAAEAFPQCSKVIKEIRDQSNCGCCWAFGAASAASDRLCIATNATTQVSLSANLCFCASSDGCGGGDLFTPWSFIQTQGVVTGGQVNNSGPFNDTRFCSNFDLPHCHHHGPQGTDPYPAEGDAGCPSQESRSCPTQCDSGAKAPHDNYAKDKWGFNGLVMTYGPDEEMIAEEIMARGPVEAAFLVYSDFENYVSGIYHHTSSEIMGGHAIRIVGWGEENGVKYWKIANSWNPYWGENGYFRILRGSNECNIESQVTANSPDAEWKKK